MKCASRYEAKKVLGQGAFGTVLLAQDKKTKEEVALKVLSFFDLDRPKTRAEFIQEAERMASLEHEAIVPVKAFCEDGLAPYFVMPVFAGSLESKLTKKTPHGEEHVLLPLVQVAKILLRLASAFDYLHEHGFVHLDVKPDNVLLDKRGNAYLSDLGLAAAYGARLSGPRGNPLYMAPERRGGGKASSASDIYSLALLAYLLLFGDFPPDRSFDEFYELWADDDSRLKSSSTSRRGRIPMPQEPRVTPRMVRKGRPGLPPQSLATFFSRALANDPDKRFPTATAMVERLIEILADPEAK